MDRQLFKETFSYMHASEDTITEVMKMAKKQDMKKTERHPVRTGVLIGLAAALLIGGAYAAAGTGFIQSVFGPKGQENIAPHEAVEEAKGSTYEAPGREWAQADEEQAQALIGEHIAAVGESVSVGNWTLTVDDYTIDDHGLGAIVYTLSNPNGLGDAIRDAGYGEYYVDGNNPDGLREIGLEGSSEGHMFDTRNIVDKNLTTDTELHAVMYFAAMYRLESGESIRMTLFRFLSDENYNTIEEEEQSLIFTPDSYIPTVELVSAEGYAAHLSPLGVTFDAAFEGADPEAYTKTLTVQFADGTEYAVISGDPYMDNGILGCASFEENVEAHVFNRLVDTDSVVSVTRNGPEGATLVFTPTK